MNLNNLNAFYDEMKNRGYIVRFDESSFYQFQNENVHVVTKDNFYHVAIEEKVILEAPIDYLVNHVKHEFKRLENEVTQ
jgi:hypothetical protein